MTPRKEATARQCSICGQVFMPTTLRGQATTCSKECSRQLNLQRGRERNAKYRAGVMVPKRSEMYTVVSDAIPPEDGGFSPGASFDSMSVQAMLRSQSFALGCILQRGRQTYRVIMMRTVQGLLKISA